MRALTVVFPSFMNVGMLEEQQRIWASYPESLRRQLHVIVVDDCSPKGHRPNADTFWIDGLASLRFYRLLEKKKWNWLACRNLGMIQATTDWVLLTDVDHAIPPLTLEHLITSDLRESCAYRFKRIVAPTPWPYDVASCKPWKPHNDSWLLTRQMFFYDDGQKFVMGYDERLSGCYGTSGEFKDRVCAVATAVIERDDVLIRYPREVIPDASTLPTLYPRKNNPANDADLAKRKRRREQIPNWRPVHLSVKWEAVPLRQSVAA